MDENNLDERLMESLMRMEADGITVDDKPETSDILKSQGIDIEGTDLEASEKENNKTDEKNEEVKVVTGIDINTETTFPNICIPKASLIEAFNIGSPLINPSSNFAVLNSINIIPKKEENKITLMTFNNMNWFTYDINLSDTGIHKGELLEDKLSINSSLFLKLVPMMGNQVLIYKVVDESREDNGKLYIRLMDGDLILDLKEPEDNYINTVYEKGEEIGKINTSDLGNIIKTMLPLVNIDIKPSNQQISFNGDYAFYNSSIYVIKGKINSIPMILKRTDCLFVKQLSNKFKNDTVNVYKVKDSEINEVLLECGNIKYVFVNGDVQIDEKKSALLDDVITRKFVEVDYNQLLRVTSLVVGLTYSTGRVGFRFTPDFLEATIPTRYGISYFDIKYTAENPSISQKDAILIPANELKKLLQSFTDTSKINICIENNMVIVKHKDFVAVFMHILN